MTAPAVSAAGQWSLARGAAVLPAGGGVRFSVWAPKAKSVSVRLVSAEGVEGGGAREVALEDHGKGVWEGTVPEARAGDRYRYVLRTEEGTNARPDPVSRSQPEGVHGPSEVVDPGAFRWTDGDWSGRAMADLVIYEMHVGTFSAEGTFDGAIEHLQGLKDLGVTAIEILPVSQFPGARNWGYDGVHLYAPQNSYGGPEGLRRLVNAAHAIGLAVILDVVYNHFGPEGNYLPAYGPYFTDRYKTPWGAAVNYDDRDSDEVRRFVVDNALYWITEFHLDGLRLDAVHAIYDLGARHLLRDITEAVHAQARRLGRRAVVIAESDLNDPRLLRAPEAGYGMDAQWSDDFHHAVHALLTREERGYYADFGRVDDVATALARRFVYEGKYSAHRRRRHGAPAVDVRADRFVICLQNHDQVGNRAAGERLTALVSFEQLKLAAALMLLSPYVPMLFMGEEYGEPRPFQYFVDHGDQALVEAVRKGRKEEFASFGWGDDVPDPFDAETFARSKLDRAHASTPRGAALLALYRDLLRLRRDEPALRPGDAEAHVEHSDAEGWIALRLTPGTGRELVALFNLSAAPRRVPLPGGMRGAAWRAELSTEEPEYGGAGPFLRCDGIECSLAPWSAELYSRDVG